MGYTSILAGLFKAVGSMPRCGYLLARENECRLEECRETIVGLLPL